MAKADRRNARSVIIRREEVVEGGHHGGAWKVAYADFVTAMMAFFLLMWLLNATTEEQRRGLADYFTPTNLLSRASSGSGKPFGGHTPFDQGTMVSDRGVVQVIPGNRPIPVDDDDDDDDTLDGAAATRTESKTPSDSGKPEKASASADSSSDESPPGKPAPQAAPEKAASADRAPTKAELRAEQERLERESFERAAQQIRDAVRSDPALADLGRQLAIDMTPEGLRIQIMDEDRQPMFATGSAVPNERARLLLQKVVPVLLKLTENISIAGYTDAAPYPGPQRTNWELSADRANATRKLLADAGLPQSRIRSVTGNADRDPLLPADPLAAANRRIAIMALRDVPLPHRREPAASNPAPTAAPK